MRQRQECLSEQMPVLQPQSILMSILLDTTDNSGPGENRGGQEGLRMQMLTMDVQRESLTQPLWRPSCQGPDRPQLPSYEEIGHILCWK